MKNLKKYFVIGRLRIGLALDTMLKAIANVFR